MMSGNKKLIYGGIGAGVLVLIILFGFRAYMHHGGLDGHHGYRGHGSHHWFGDGGRDGRRHGRKHGRSHGFGGFGHMGGDRMVARLSHWLDLDEAQRDALDDAADETRTDMRKLRRQMRKSRRALHRLDPGAADYDAAVAELAGERGQLAARMTMLMGETKKTLAEVLTEEQMEELMERFE